MVVVSFRNVEDTARERERLARYIVEVRTSTVRRIVETEVFHKVLWMIGFFHGPLGARFQFPYGPLVRCACHGPLGALLHLSCRLPVTEIL